MISELADLQAVYFLLSAESNTNETDCLSFKTHVHGCGDTYLMKQSRSYMSVRYET